MSWFDDCDNYDSRIDAATTDGKINDVEFLLTQDDCSNPNGDIVRANRTILALSSPVFYTQFYGTLAAVTNKNGPVQIVDGTAEGFKQFVRFICNPLSFELNINSVDEIFDISYFAHKYQVRSLVCKCRQFLREYQIEGKELDVLNWALATENGLNFKDKFPAEHALLVHNFRKQCRRYFKDIFPGGEVKDGQELIDEEIFIKIINDNQLPVNEEFVLSVALDFYMKLMKKIQASENKRKRQKCDIEEKWNLKMVRIKSVIKFEKIRPLHILELFEKFGGEIPSKIVQDISKEINLNWKHKQTVHKFSDKAMERVLENPISNFDIQVDFKEKNPNLKDNKAKNERDSQVEYDNNIGYPHTHRLQVGHTTRRIFSFTPLYTTNTFGLHIKFKINQDAVMEFNPFDITLTECEPVGEDFLFRSSLKFQSLGEFKEEFSNCQLKGKDFRFSFYVKANEEATLSYRYKEKYGSPVQLFRLEKFIFSCNKFKLQVLEVNGKPVGDKSYCFIPYLLFTPV